MTAAGPARGIVCPRCGHAAAGGPFCPQCGRYLAVLQWVAEPPPSPVPPAPAPIRARYTGPPRYREPQRWGFPAAPWRPPADGDDAPPDALSAVRSLAGTAVPLLWAVVAVALLAAGAETWRYALLLASRAGALSARAVAASDALVVAAGSVAPLLGLLAGGVVVAWTLRASAAAADRAGVRPSRSSRATVLGWVVPGLNLTVPGSVLAEIEHAALDRSPAERPRPSRLVLVWWVSWVAGVLLSAVVLVWSRRDGVQAAADGVVLHALLDVVAAATAMLTARLVRRLTALLGPVRAARREVLVRVGPPAGDTVTPPPAVPATPA